MNPQEVAKHLPLIKIDIIEDTDDKGHIVLYTCRDIESAKKCEFKASFIEDFDSLELALEGALYIYLHGNFDIKGVTKSLKCTTRHKITLEEFVHGRDGGSEWADPENDIDKRGSIAIDIYLNEDERHQKYETGYAPYSPMFGISKAYTTFIGLMERYLPGKDDIKDIVAFEWRDRVFNKAHVVQDQLCVCGECTDPDYEGSEGNGSVKVDYFRDYVDFHRENEIRIVGKNFYMNGEKLFDVNYLISLFPNADEFSILRNGFYQCHEILEEIKKSFPNATTLSGDGFSISLKSESVSPPKQVDQ